MKSVLLTEAYCLKNICRYFAGYGLERDGQHITERLWRKFKNAEL